MSGHNHQDVPVVPAPPQDREQAYRLVLSDMASPHREDQAAALAKATQTDSGWGAGLLVVRRDRRIIGATWAQLAAGRTAVIWPPRLIDRQEEALAEKLLAAADRFLKQRHTVLAQAVLAGPQTTDAVMLRRQGYRRSVELLYLNCPAERFPRQRPVSRLAFQSYTESEVCRLSALIEQTYEATRDCPDLNGVRTVQDVLAGYRATGHFCPERWFFVQHQRRDIGCLLLNDHPGDHQWELIYMGLVPAARGRQYGLEIVRHAQWLTGRAARARLVLAVDAANEPAVGMYRAARFEVFERRSVLLKIFS